MTHARAYAATLLLFLVIDMLWLGLAARGFYADQIGDMMREQPNLVAAALFYFGYVASIVFFAVTPGIRAASWKIAARNGAILGLTAYGTFELTNLAILPGWPVTMAVVDMVWGAVLTGTTAAGACLMVRWRRC